MAQSQSDPCWDRASATPMGGLTFRASLPRDRRSIVFCERLLCTKKRFKESRSQGGKRLISDCIDLGCIDRILESNTKRYIYSHLFSRQWFHDL
jgi:hypothetical protein